MKNEAIRAKALKLVEEFSNAMRLSAIDSSRLRWQVHPKTFNDLKMHNALDYAHRPTLLGSQVEENTSIKPGVFRIILFSEAEIT